MIAEAATTIDPTRASPASGAARCAHCALPVPAGLIEPAARHQFCCPGCRAVYDTIHACGLDSYYRLRDAADATFKPATPGAESFDVFDTSAFQSLYVTADPASGTKHIDLILEGVTCAACVWLVERLPKVLDGVIEARLSLREATVRVTWDPARLSLSRIARTLDAFGYTPHPAKGQSRKQLLVKDERRRLIHLGVAGALMGNTMLLGFALYAGLPAGMEAPFRTLFRWLSAALGTLALVWPGAVFFRSAFAALRTRTINLDVPITLALLVGGVAGAINVALDRGDMYFDSLSVLVFLLLVGRWFQYRQQRRADAAVELLFSLTPATCRLVADDGRVTDAPVEALKTGDVVEVRSGDLIPADGVVLAGRSAVNQSLLTGESVPAEVAPGTDVSAGAQNVGSALRVRVTQVGQDTRVGRLMNLVERGLADKPSIVQFTDKVGTAFTAAVSLGAAAIFAYWARRAGVTPAIDHTVAFLIVTCPCVLGLATPLTLALAIGRLARADILVKSGAALERLARGGRLLLDKTGTLTRGTLELTEWHGDPALRPIVAAAERLSCHPIAKALVAAMGDEPAGEQPTDIVERNDGGLRATVDRRTLLIGSPTFIARQAVVVPPEMDARRRALESAGATVVLIAIDGRCAALAALRDSLRPDTVEALAALRHLGYTSSILSGDATPVVQSVAAQLGVPAARAVGEVSPEHKLAAVHHAAADQGVTVMVGDGVNDAAALAAADVGIAVHGGAEASLAAADVYIARPGLTPLVHLVRTARHAMRVIRRNLLVSLSYNLLAGTLAATGVMSPLIAAIIMPVSSATVLSLAALAITTRKAD
jgi:Cu2+-exporting ATPase